MMGNGCMLNEEVMVVTGWKSKYGGDGLGGWVECLECC